MSAAQLIKKQFTAQKLFFHFLFWSVHWGLFAFGWYVVDITEGSKEKEKKKKK